MYEKVTQYHTHLCMYAEVKDLHLCYDNQALLIMVACWLHVNLRLSVLLGVQLLDWGGSAGDLGHHHTSVRGEWHAPVCSRTPKTEE